MLSRAIRSSLIAPQLMAVAKRAPALAILQAQYCHHEVQKALRPLGPKNVAPEFKVLLVFPF
jgi:hypothetical protein